MRKELASFGQVRFGETVLAESGKFDYIVLPLSARHPQRLKCELEHSLRLLYDGSRVFFTVPRKEFDHEQFFACLVNELKYQQVFLAAPVAWRMCGVLLSVRGQGDPQGRGGY